MTRHSIGRAGLLAVLLLFPAPARATVTAFRITQLDVRDPHFFASFIGCHDVTDTPFGGFAINDRIHTSMTTDSDGDGQLDRSDLLLFDPLDPSSPSGPLEFTTGDCTAPAASTTCTPGTVSYTNVSYVNPTTGTCLGVLPGTTHPYSPPVTTATSPCFVTDALTFFYDVAGIPLLLYDARISGTYAGSPPTGIVNGLIRGFEKEDDANQTTIPASYPLIGGQTLASVLPGGTGNCSATNDKDIDNGATGWWFYLNFTAQVVPYSDPNAGVEPPSALGASFAAAYPNPFGASVSLEYTLPVASAVQLAVFDPEGRHVADVAGGIQTPGRHTAIWNGRDASGARAAAGLYFVRLEALGRTATKRIVLER